MGSDIGTIMKDWRQYNNLTVEAAAEKVDVSKSTWSDLESGKRQPNIETLIALSDALNIPLRELAQQAGYNVRLSETPTDRQRRIAELVASNPRLSVAMDKLLAFPVSELDTVLTIIEALHQKRQELQLSQLNDQ